MHTKLITLQVSLLAPPELAPPGQLQSTIVGSDRLHSEALRSHIQTQLAQHGDPLRWAITTIDTVRQTAQVEAVVTIL